MIFIKVCASQKNFCGTMTCNAISRFSVILTITFENVAFHPAVISCDTKIPVADPETEGRGGHIWQQAY